MCSVSKKSWLPSLQRALRLADAGCNVPLEAFLPEETTRRRLYVRPLAEYGLEGLVVEREGGTGYVVPLRVGTDLSSAIVMDVDFRPPWPDHQFIWDCFLESLLPENLRSPYLPFVRSRLREVLEERRVIYAGRPVDGLMCFATLAPIPDSVPRDRPAIGGVVLVDRSGLRVQTSIPLRIVRIPGEKARTRLVT